MPVKITRLDIEGFRSLRKVSWQPGDLNVVIGPNGSGKSNLLHFLELISVSAQGRLGKYIQSLGGMDAIVWDGVADSIKFSMGMPHESDELWRLNYYELELLKLGAGSSYKVGRELLSGGTDKERLKFIDRDSIRAVILSDYELYQNVPFESLSDEDRRQNHL
ncbi:MAG: AAA family ATPase [Candidatus Methylumidiphilus sp.]